MSTYELPKDAPYKLPASDNQTGGGSTGSKLLSKGEAGTIKARLKAAERYYEQSFRDNYLRCREIYRGDHWPKQASKKRHRPVVNVLKHSCDTKHASIAFNYPEFILKPLTEEAEANQDTATRAVSYEYQQAKAQRELKRAWKDREVCDLGVVVTGWEYQTRQVQRTDGRDPVEGDLPDPEMVQALLESGEPIPAPTPEDEVEKDQFYCRRLNPAYFRISPEAGRVLELSPWCGHVEFLPLDKVKANPRYRNTKAIKGSTKFMLDFTENQQPSNKQSLDKQDAQPADIKRVELWHYYEMERRLHCIFCPEVEGPLLVEEWQSKAGRYPYRVMLAPGDEDDFYPNPPRLIQWFALQQEINETRQDMHIHRSRFKRKYQCAASMLDSAAEKALNSAEDGAVVYHKGTPGAQVVLPIVDAQLSGDLWHVAEQAMHDLSLLTGLDQYQLASPPSKRLTEGEVTAIQNQGGAIKEQDAQEFEAACAGVAEDCYDWLLQFPERAKTLPIYDPRDDTKISEWRPYTAAEIQGGYQFSVYVGSTQIQDRIGSIKEKAFYLQTLTPFMQMQDPATGGPLLNGKELLRQFLSGSPDLKDVSAILNVPPPAPPVPPGGLAGPQGPGAPGPPGGIDPMQALAEQAAMGGHSGPPGPPMMPPMGPGGA